MTGVRYAGAALAALLLLLLPASGVAREDPAAALAALAVPRPFEPLRVTQPPGSIDVALWGRTYRFAAGPLPSEIRSQGTALLAGRPSVRAASRGQDLEVAWQTPSLVEARPEVVRLRSIGALPGLRLEAETRIEYDGMIAVDLALVATEGVQLQRLEYRLPLAADTTQLFTHHLPYDYQVENVDKKQLLQACGRLPPRLELAFVPTLAIGDRRVGIEWWSETNAHWKTRPRARPFEVTRGPAATELRVTPIELPFALAPGAAWQDSFALFVFPARPPPERWRSVRFLPYNRSSHFDPRIGTRFVFLASQTSFHARWDGLPASLDDGFQRDRRAELERRDVGYMPYGMLNLAPILHPRTMSQFEEWSAEGKWWRLQKGFDNPVISRNRPDLGPGAPYTYPVCAARKDYYDWMLEENVNTLRAERLDALYFDHGAITRMCVRNPRIAGGGPLRAKESWEYRNVREFYKRLYEQAKHARSDVLIVIHTNGAPRALGAFVDFHIFGEALNGHFGGGRPAAEYFSNPNVYTPDYLALPDGYLDANLFPPVGGVSSVIPQIKWASDPAHPERVRGFQRAFQSIVLSNDAHAPLWVSDLDTADEIYRALDRFGDIGSAVAHPWWSNGSALRGPAGVRATAWVRDGRALLVLANPGASEQRGRVELDRHALGVPEVRRVRDLERPTKRRVTLDVDGFPVTVPPRDLRIFALE
jgi:hypothetical protein